MEKRDELLGLLIEKLGTGNNAMSTIVLERALWMVSDPETPSELLEILLSSDHPLVLERIADHPNAQLFVLEILSSHAQPEVRAAVSENPNVTVEILVRLSEDEHPDVRYRLAENPCVAPAVLHKLTEDTNPYVAHRAQSTLMKMNMERPPGALRSIMRRVSDGLSHLRAG